MASPVSFGDAFLMSKLAWNLAQVFTTGRKSAPAEFREVESQLYSLSAALTALRDARADGRAAISINVAPSLATSHEQENSSQRTIDNILRSCDETLKHLQKTVEKYGIVTEPSDSSRPILRRWSQELVKNWKKIEWTTKKGDLATLKSQIMVHTNSLNLVLGVIVKSVTNSISTCRY